jgi:hypothetical protein
MQRNWHQPSSYSIYLPIPMHLRTIRDGGQPCMWDELACQSFNTSLVKWKAYSCHAMKDAGWFSTFLSLILSELNHKGIARAHFHYHK